MVGAFERVAGRARRKQPRMPGKEVLEAKIGHDVAFSGCRAVLKCRALANQRERLWQVFPLHRLHVKAPQIPLRFHDERRVRIQMLHGQRCNLRRPIVALTQIPLHLRGLRVVHRLHGEQLKAVRRFRDARSSQETRELRDHGLFGKVARPHAQIRPVGHKPWNYTGTRLNRCSCSAQALAAWPFSPKPAAICCSLSRSVSPNRAKTSAEASRRRSSAAAAICAITSRDWWFSVATVATIHEFEMFSRRPRNSATASSPILWTPPRISACWVSFIFFQESHSSTNSPCIRARDSCNPFSNDSPNPLWKRRRKSSCCMVTL